MSSELRTTSGFVFADERVEIARALTRDTLKHIDATQRILDQALPRLSPWHSCPECHQPMERYGINYRCECGHVEEG